MKAIFTALILTILAVTPIMAANPLPAVKMSKSGICHDQNSSWYSRTKTYTEFSDLDSCLSSGGRLPKGHSATITTASATSGYDRERYFGSWIDSDGDCFNTRHEILASLSTGPVTTQGCRVIHGRWNDPYTGMIFTESSKLDIDHLVPLKWAWDHGADSWTQEQRVAFANNPQNLFAVKASANRSKSADGPLEWLPPNKDYQCEYVIRFKRIALTWKLKFEDNERAMIDQLQNKLCQ